MFALFALFLATAAPPVVTPAWENPAWDIEVCADSPASVARVRQAARFWTRRLGVEWGEVYISTCHATEPADGTIRVEGMPAWYFDHLIEGATLSGVTLSAWGDDQIDDEGDVHGTPAFHIVRLPTSYQTSWVVLEHELGHALGFNHVPGCSAGGRPHVMCRQAAFAGRSTRGLGLD